MKRWIKVTGLECPICENKIWSKYTHDFRYCECGYCFVDGGRDYMRCGWGYSPMDRKERSQEEYLEVSEFFSVFGPPKSIKLIVEDPGYIESRWPY